MSVTLTPQQVLDLPLLTPDYEGVSTVREYLLALLTALWDDNENFDAKRPLGNGGWANDVYAALIRGAAVDGTLDEHGGIDTMSYDDEDRADDLIRAAIKALR